MDADTLFILKLLASLVGVAFIRVNRGFIITLACVIAGYAIIRFVGI